MGEGKRLKPVKIVDLAARLGIDKATVSRALNNRPGVAPKTRDRIVRLARELGYTPNVHGQQLRGWKSKTLALVMGANVDTLREDAIALVILLWSLHPATIPGCR